MIAIDFAGQYLKYSVFRPDCHGIPLHDVSCECAGRLKCPNWLFRPHPKQIRFFDSRSPRVMFGGGRGGGKTESLVWKPIQTAYRIEKCNMVCFRRTMGELKKTLLKAFWDMPQGVYEKCTEDVVTFHNGSRLWWGSADDEKAIRKLLSGEYVLIEFDEWSEWKLSMWKFAEGSLRTPVEFDLLGNPVVAQLVGATNPGGEGGESLAHLFGCGRPKRQAPGEDPSTYKPEEYEFIQSLVGDNPAYSEDSPAGIEYRARLNSQPRRIRAAWLEGRWDGFEGQYFDILDEAVTKIRHDDFLKLIRKQHWAPRWGSIDWGMTHHAAVGWHALLTIGGREVPVTYRTYVTKGIGEAALAEEICDLTEPDGFSKFVKWYLSPETFGDTSHSRARRIGDVFAARGLPRPVPANNKREDGWRLMHDLLRKRYEGIRLLPDAEARTLAGWLITDHQTDGPNEPPHPLECLTQAVCDPKKDGDVMKDGDALHLDVNDMLRYGIASHISPEQEPFEDRLKDKLENLPVSGNERYMEHLKMLKAERENQSGVFYIGAKPKRRR